MDSGEGRKVMRAAMKRAMAAFHQSVEEGTCTIGEMAMQYYFLMHACNDMKESFIMERKQ